MLLIDVEYYVKVQVVLDGIEVFLDCWLDEDVVDIDIYCIGGLLELSLFGGSKIIINIQLLLQEIWLVVCGGGFYFCYCDGCWLDMKIVDEFFIVLFEQVSWQVGKCLDFSV